jgi:uncharacterized protein YdeI (YjbR/CyaY-like superfamily)
MKLGNLYEPPNRKAWRSWLAKHRKTEREIWLVYNKKSTGRYRISYNDAVEEALCYGWIDSITKRIDDKRYAQRFSPRRPTSGLSEMNLQRVRKLIKQKKMTKAGINAIAHVFDPSDTKKTKVTIAPDIIKALKANEGAWKNFQKFPQSYKRIRLAYLESQRKHGKEQYGRALKHFVKMTATNKRFGFVKEMQ